MHILLGEQKGKTVRVNYCSKYRGKIHINRLRESFGEIMDLYQYRGKLDR